MNNRFLSFRSKALSILSLVLCCAFGVSANTTISADPVSFSNMEKVLVPVNFSNDASVAMLQFDVILPDFLEFDGSITKNPERFTDHVVSFNPNNGRVVISSMSITPIKGESGVLLYLPVKVKDSISSPISDVISFTNILFVDTDDTPINQDAFDVDAAYVPYSVTVSATPSSLTLNRETSASIGFDFEADCDVIGFQMDLVLPEGLTLGDVATLSQRTPGDAFCSVFHNTGYDRIIYASMSNTPLSGNSGRVFDINVSRSEDFTSGEIVVKNILISYAAGEALAVDNFTIVVNNESATYTSLTTLVTNLRNKLSTTLASIAEQCPNVKDSFPGTELAGKIDTLAGKIDAAYAEGSLSTVADSLTAEADALTAEIDAYLAEAVAAEAKWEADRRAANEAAYNAVLASIAELQAYYDETVAAVAENYPEADVEAEKTAAKEALDAARAAAQAAYDAVAEAGIFDYTVPAEDIKTLIDAITAKAIADNEAARQEWNTNAYNSAIASLDELQTKLNEAIAFASGECPHANVLSEVNAAQTAITNARNQAELARLACVSEGLFDYTVPYDDILALIETVSTSAQEQEEAWIEAQRRAANEAAYNLTLAVLADFQDDLDMMKEKVAELFPEADVTAEIEAAQKAIDDARTAADEEYASVQEEGYYDYTIDEEAIDALIDAIYTAAQQSGIRAISLDNIDKNALIFNLRGVRVANAVKGQVVIIVPQNGMPYKVVVE
ncbi:MAG: hypothetical protein ACI4AK_06720 [Lepagella sp.]